MDNDFNVCMGILNKSKSKINFISRITGDMFNCGMTEFLTPLITPEALKLIREEFVSWIDVLAGTRREMLDLGISEKDIATVQRYLTFFKEKVTCLQTVECEYLEELCG